MLRRPEGIDLKYLLRTQHNNLFVQMLAIFSKPVSAEGLNVKSKKPGDETAVPFYSSLNETFCIC